MVSEGVPLGYYPLYEFRLLLREILRDEECRLDPLLLQDIKDLRGIPGLIAFVECQVEFHFARIHQPFRVIVLAPFVHVINITIGDIVLVAVLFVCTGIVALV